ncbi:MAG: hypothetical protein ABI355_09900 [Solirubrobacteraceae bacterium]
MSTIGTILSTLLALAFAGAGGTKVANVDPHETEFPRYRLPSMDPQQARMLVGALGTHAQIGDAPPVMAPAAVLAILAVLLLILA